MDFTLPTPQANQPFLVVIAAVRPHHHHHHHFISIQTDGQTNQSITAIPYHLSLPCTHNTHSHTHTVTVPTVHFPHLQPNRAPHLLPLPSAKLTCTMLPVCITHLSSFYIQACLSFDSFLEDFFLVLLPKGVVKNPIKERRKWL